MGVLADELAIDASQGQHFPAKLTARGFHNVNFIISIVGQENGASGGYYIDVKRS